MKYRVTYWHGLGDKLKELLDAIAVRAPEDGYRTSWIFEGNLEDFLAKWKDKFVYYPTEGEETKGTIYVTMESGFGMR